jgi:hypothetical protein
MKATEELAGKKAICGNCGHKFAIPRAETADDDFKPLNAPKAPSTFVPATPDETRSRKVLKGLIAILKGLVANNPYRTRTHTALLWLAGVLAAAAVSALLTAFVVWLMGPVVPAEGAEPPAPILTDPMAGVATAVIFSVFAGVLWFAVVYDEKTAARKHDEAARNAAIAAAIPTHGRIACPYCSTAIAEDVLYAGQTITCPSCHGVLAAPGGPGAALRKAEFEYAQNKVLIQGLGFIGSMIVFVAVLRGCF